MCTARVGRVGGPGKAVNTQHGDHLALHRRQSVHAEPNRLVACPPIEVRRGARHQGRMQRDGLITALVMIGEPHRPHARPFRLRERAPHSGAHAVGTHDQIHRHRGDALVRGAALFAAAIDS